MEVDSSEGTETGPGDIEVHAIFYTRGKSSVGFYSTANLLVEK